MLSKSQTIEEHRRYRKAALSLNVSLRRMSYRIRLLHTGFARCALWCYAQHR